MFKKLTIPIYPPPKQAVSAHMIHQSQRISTESLSIETPQANGLDSIINDLDHDRENADAEQLIKDEDDFWVFIAKLNWCDRSDHYINKEQITRKITTALGPSDIGRFKFYCEKLMDTLKKQIIDDKCMYFEGAYFDKKSFLSHIVARGREYYYSILESTDVAEYLLSSYGDEFQNFWVCIPK